MEYNVRPVQREDIPYFEQYWLNQTEADLARLGEPSRPDLIKMKSFLQRYTSDSESSLKTEEGLLVWIYRDNPIGYCSLKNIKLGQDAEVHLHMWERSLWGKGLGKVFFCLCAKSFYKTYSLKNIYCQPNAENLMPNKLLNSLGFKKLNSLMFTIAEHGRAGIHSNYQIDLATINQFLADRLLLSN